MKLLDLPLVLCLSQVLATHAKDEEFVKTNWYTRYPSYPDYCSTPAQMEERKIPPLAGHPAYGESRIVHASVIIRHGARTPWGNQAKCWKGYWDNPETGVWDCRLTQFVAPPSDLIVDKEEEIPVDGASDAVFLFEKKYDAFHLHPNNSHGGSAHSEGLSNKLNGTCQIGQLLLQGYEQQIANGKHLREAYCFNGETPYNHDISLRLLDLSKEPYQYPQLQYRSDDDERTVMSGQVLLRGMFEQELKDSATREGTHPVIALHTADRTQDVLSGNSNVCPKLEKLEDAAKSSSAYKKLADGDEGKHLKDFMKEHLGQVMDISPVDCLMTTICTDRPLPKAIDDYTSGRRVSEDGSCSESQGNCTDGNTKGDNVDKASYFRRIYEYYVELFEFHFLYNNAAYSKLAIAPLWREILVNILPIIHPENYNRYQVAPETARLALFSGHDTTITPLMATLGVWNETDWPPYASMMIIEIHEIGIDGQQDRNYFESKYAFRLLYNGQVMTPLIDACPDTIDLCDVRILDELVVPLAMEPWDCDLNGWKEAVASTWAETKHLFTTAGGAVVLLLIIFSSGVAGGIATFAYLTGRLPSRCMGKSFAFGSSARRVSEQGLSLTQGQFDQNALDRATIYGSADTAGDSLPLDGKDDGGVNSIT